MIYAYKRNMESEVETELEEEGRTDSQKTNGLEFFGVSQAPTDKVKVKISFKKQIKNFLPFDDGC